MKSKSMTFLCLSLSSCAALAAAPSISVLVDGKMGSMFNDMLSVMTSMGYVAGTVMIVSVIFGMYRSAQNGDIEGALSSSVVKIGAAIMMMSAPQIMVSMLSEISPFPSSAAVSEQQGNSPTNKERESVVYKESKGVEEKSPEGWDAKVVSKAAWSDKGK